MARADPATSGWDEEVAHSGEDRDEALEAPRRTEALHLPPPFSEGAMAVLGPVVEPLVGAVLEAGRDLPLRGAVRGQPVRHDPSWEPALLLEEPDEQAARGARVAAALQALARHDAVLVDGPPQPVDLAANHDPDLVEVPHVARPRRPAPQLPREDRAELHPPPAHRLVGDVDPALEQHLLDHSQAERGSGRGATRRGPMISRGKRWRRYRELIVMRDSAYEPAVTTATASRSS